VVGFVVLLVNSALEGLLLCTEVGIALLAAVGARLPVGNVAETHQMARSDWLGTIV
jgi:hypothetical protein